MKLTKRELNNYLKQIKKLNIYSGSRKKAFMNSFEDNIEEYLKANPDADLSKLQEEIGTPQEIANAFLENESAAGIKKRMSIGRFVKIAVIIALILLAFMVVFELIDAYKSNIGYTEETITEESVSEDNDNVEEEISIEKPEH